MSCSYLKKITINTINLLRFERVSGENVGNKLIFSNTGRECPLFRHIVSAVLKLNKESFFRIRCSIILQ